MLSVPYSCRITNVRHHAAVNSLSCAGAIYPHPTARVQVIDAESQADPLTTLWSSHTSIIGRDIIEAGSFSLYSSKRRRMLHMSKAEVSREDSRSQTWRFRTSMTTDI